MHSSGMRTARFLTVSPSMHWTGGGVPRGVCAQGCVCPGVWVCVPRGVGVCAQGRVCLGVCVPRGVCPGDMFASGPTGVSASGPGCVCIPACNGADTPPVDRHL